MDLENVAYRLGLISEGLSRENLDGLLFYAREIHNEDSLIYQLLGTGLSGHHAILVGRKGRPKVIANIHDAGNVPKDLYDVVEFGFEDDSADIIAKYLKSQEIEEIGLAVSRDIAALDVIPHGMFLRLNDAVYKRGIRINSAKGENVLYSAYARRTPGEIEGLRRAVKTTDEIFDAAEAEILKTGKTEMEVHAFFLGQMDRRGIKPSWARDRCPIVAVKNNSVRGHHQPGDDFIIPGYAVFIDFGSKDPGTNMPADLQRSYFVPDPDNQRETQRVQDMFRLQRRARDAAISRMVSGSTGFEVDKAGRDVIVDAKYPPFTHALGHTLSAEGVHGIGPIAGPMLPKYGSLPTRKLEPGMVLTSEPSVIDPEGRQGRLSSEYDVLVTETCPEILNKRQDELILLSE